jgi:predicted RNase H-like HicB family nuclease
MTDSGLAEHYLSLPYSKVLVRDESGGYTAHISELPGCIAEGETPDEAVRALDDAMEDWIEAVLESGTAVPPPLRVEGFSGRLVLRLPKTSHRMAAERAQADGVSLNQWIVEAVGERLGAEALADRLCIRVASTLLSPYPAESQPALTGRVAESPAETYGKPSRARKHRA